MKRSRNIPNLFRVSLLILTICTLVGGVTYATLQTQAATITGSQISTAIANLQISPDGMTFSKTEQGFSFTNVIPGGQATPATGNTFFLKNAGGTALALKLAVSSNPGNPDGVDLTKVNVILTPSGAGQPQTFTLASLIDAYSSGGVALTTPALASGAQQQFQIQVSMAANAITSQGSTINTIDFSFSGAMVN